MSTTFPTKDPSESITVTFDFSAETTAVTAPTVTNSVMWSYTTDPSPSAMLSGSAQVSGALVLQRVLGGVDLTNYGLRCQATAANGDTLVVAGVLPVRKQPT
jgi:hypothetical protein